jgi:hypothetical protein
VKGERSVPLLSAYVKHGDLIRLQRGAEEILQQLRGRHHTSAWIFASLTLTPRSRESRTHVFAVRALRVAPRGYALLHRFFLFFFFFLETSKSYRPPPPLFPKIDLLIYPSARSHRTAGSEHF